MFLVNGKILVSLGVNEVNADAHNVGPRRPLADWEKYRKENIYIVAYEPAHTPNLSDGSQNVNLLYKK